MLKEQCEKPQLFPKASLRALGRGEGRKRGTGRGSKLTTMLSMVPERFKTRFNLISVAFGCLSIYRDRDSWSIYVGFAVDRGMHIELAGNIFWGKIVPFTLKPVRLSSGYLSLPP